MKYRALTRATIAAAATTAALLPLAACSAGDGGGSRSSTNPSEPLPSPASSSSSEAPTTRATASTGEYTDGIYTARGIYGGAPSYMDFTITLDGGKITAVESQLMPDNNDISRGYQERFAGALPDEVEGKGIECLAVDKIAGASGCTDGFNDALDKIRKQAATGN